MMLFVFWIHGIHAILDIPAFGYLGKLVTPVLSDLIGHFLCCETIVLRLIRAIDKNP